MVKITTELLAKCPSRTNKKKGETQQQYLKRLTHVYLAEKSIDEIDNLSLCRNLSVLYLYDNYIGKIENLGFATNLTHIYLQKNKIVKIEGLQNLKKLTKLYLGHNQISVVEGLETLQNLSELHVENQQLPVGEKLLFDPRSLKALSNCLNVLNISGNNIDRLQEFHCLTALVKLTAENNLIKETKQLSKALNVWPTLLRLELTGNPVCDKKKYRDRVLVMSNSLVMLDGKEISATAKKFLINWKENREARKRQQMEKAKRAEQQKVTVTMDSAERNPVYFQALPPMLPQFHSFTTTGTAHSYTTMTPNTREGTFASDLTGSRIPQTTRFPNIFASHGPGRGQWSEEGGRHPLPLQTVQF